jgi:hypothetical protein
MSKAISKTKKSKPVVLNIQLTEKKKEDFNKAIGILNYKQAVTWLVDQVIAGEIVIRL